MALYHSYRPQSFDDVLGQPHIVAVLKSAIANDRVGHAYLFSGPRGVGKTSVARILAKAINCQERAESGESRVEGIPCNKCPACISITNGSALDVIEIDAASNRGIDEIRELRDRVRFAPTQLKKKVYIIDEVHMLTKEAFNALLKTLEEPPAHAVFVLATTELQKIPETIFSRCQHFQFRRANPEAVGKHLIAIAKDEGRTIEPDALELLVLRSEGSYRDALSALEQILTADPAKAITATKVRELFGLPAEETALDTLAAIAAGDRARILELLEELATLGIALESFVAELIRVVRLLLFITTLGQERFGGGSDQLRAALPGLLDAFDTRALLALLTGLTEATTAMRTSPLPSIPGELLLLSESNNRAPQSQPRSSLPQAKTLQKSEPAVAVSKYESPVAERAVESTTVEAEPVVNQPSEISATIDQVVATPTDQAELTHDIWRLVRQTLAKQDTSLTMILGDRSEPPRREGNRVILDVPYKFHVDRLLDPKARRLIEAALTDAIGTNLVFECQVVPISQVAVATGRAREAVVEDIVGALSEL